jgi:hypothetical protein
MENKISWQQMDPPLDNGRRQWIEVRGSFDTKVVFGECNICVSDTYDEEEDIPNRLYSSKYGLSFGQNICHRCWVKV